MVRRQLPAHLQVLGNLLLAQPAAVGQQRQNLLLQPVQQWPWLRLDADREEALVRPLDLGPDESLGLEDVEVVGGRAVPQLEVVAY